MEKTNDGWSSRPSKKRGRGNYRANNEGGYGNPPIKGQSKRGDPGGPGRRRGTTSLEAALTKMFASKVPVMMKGQAVNISMGEAIAERLRQEIMSGNFKALELGLDLMHKYGPVQQTNELPMFDISALSIEDMKVLRRLLMTADHVERREIFKLMKQGKVWHDAKRKGSDT